MKNLIKRITAFLKRLTGKAFELLRENAGLAVRVTDNIKKLVENPAADVLTALIPGDLDAAALAALRRVLPGVSEKLALAFNIINENSKNADVVAATIEHLRSLEPGVRSVFWLSFSAELNAALSDGKISLAEAAALAQMIYTEKKNS
jgi:hypothetical protein